MEKVNKYLDYADMMLCKLGILKTAQWASASRADPIRLYAGKLRRGLPQYPTHFGITPFFPSLRNIDHDVTAPMPLGDSTVASYQSEDVFEHVPTEKIVGMFDEIHRVLKPGGLFRLSLPDYGNPMYRDRTVLNASGELLYDPGGGGRLENGKVVGGGHVWFPTYDNVLALFAKSRFATNGTVRVLHANLPSGEHLMEAIDYRLGYVQRTPDNDDRAANPRRPLSLVIDATKLS